MTVFQIKHFFYALVLFSLWACQPQGASSLIEQGGDSPQQLGPKLYKITGSKTLGAVLMPALLDAYLGQLQVEKLEKEHLSAGCLYRWEQAGRKVRLELLPKGSQAGFSALVAGQAQMAMASKEIDDSLLAQLPALKQEQQLLLAYDALRVLVHKEKAEIKELSKLQLGKIFRGEIRDWAEIDLRFSGPIRLYMRNEQSGSFHFVQRILGELGAVHKQQENFDYLLQDLANDPNGLAFAPYDLPEGLSVSTVAVAGRKANLQDLQYLFRRPLYLYLDALALEEPFWQDFMFFCRSKEGQKIVAQSGFANLGAPL